MPKKPKILIVRKPNLPGLNVASTTLRDSEDILDDEKAETLNGNLFTSTVVKSEKT